MECQTIPLLSWPSCSPATFRRVAAFAWLGLMCFAGSAYSADKAPAIKVTTTPATATSGPVVKIEGKFSFKYTAYADVADDTTFDLTGMQSVTRPDHPLATMFAAGEQQTPPKNLRIIGGVYHGAIPLEWSWTLTTRSEGEPTKPWPAVCRRWKGARIHNAVDGWRPGDAELQSPQLPEQRQFPDARLLCNGRPR